VPSALDLFFELAAAFPNWFSFLHAMILARGVGHPLSYPPVHVKIFSIERLLIGIGLDTGPENEDKNRPRESVETVFASSTQVLFIILAPEAWDGN